MKNATYPIGCRVILDYMDDPASPPIGTQGTVTGTDAQKSILIDWDNGSGLNVTEVDRIHKVATDDEAVITLNWYGKNQPDVDARCPRCGAIMWGPKARHALSRYAAITVCDRCGMEESLERAEIVEMKPLMKWCAVELPAVGGGAWRR